MFTRHDNRELPTSSRRGLIPRLFEQCIHFPTRLPAILESWGRSATLVGFIVCIGFTTTLNSQDDKVTGAIYGSLPVILFDSISYDSYNPDTFLHTRVGIERGFRSMGFRGDLQIHRFGVALEPGKAYLSLHFYEYSTKRVRLIAFYVKDGERRKAGYYSQNLKVGLGPAQAPEWMIEQIGRRLFVELQNRFPEDFAIEPEVNDES